ncbi:MAG: DUF523 domain-containing protein [Candidatus Omnitrophota bacterium]|nr:DUF523 domain-containing protein [Candidatus Omnitrophota bacterium]
MTARKHVIKKDVRYKFIVSACLAGINCTYKGEGKLRRSIKALVENGRAIPVCPEVLGGLPTPRENAEIMSKGGEEVLMKKAKVAAVSGEDVSGYYLKGARTALALADRHGIKKAILKSNSPSCGYGRIYDGTFRRVLKKGNGVFAALLLKKGFTVLTEKAAIYAK